MNRTSDGNDALTRASIAYHYTPASLLDDYE